MPLFVVETERDYDRNTTVVRRVFPYEGGRSLPQAYAPIRQSVFDAKDEMDAFHIMQEAIDRALM